MANRFLPPGFPQPNFTLNPLQFAKAGGNWVSPQWDNALTQGQIQMEKFKRGLERKVLQAQADLEKNLDILYNKTKQVGGKTITKGTTGNLKVNNPNPINSLKATAKPFTTPITKGTIGNVLKGAGPIASTVGKYAGMGADALMTGYNILAGNYDRGQTAGHLGGSGLTLAGLGTGNLPLIAAGLALHGATGLNKGYREGLNKLDYDKLARGEYAPEDGSVKNNMYGGQLNTGLLKDPEKAKIAWDNRNDVWKAREELAKLNNGKTQADDNKDDWDLIDIASLLNSTNPNPGIEEINQLFDLPPLPNYSQANIPINQLEPIGSPITGVNIPQGQNIPNQQLPILPGSENGLSENDIMTLFGLINNNNQEQQAINRVVNNQQAVPQSPYSDYEKQLLEQLSNINQQLTNVNTNNTNGNIRQRAMVSLAGINPDSIFGSPVNEYERLSNLQSALANQLKLQSAVEQNAIDRRTREVLRNVATGNGDIQSMLPYLISNEKIGPAIIKELIAPGYNEYLDINKDQRAFNKMIAQQGLSNLGQLAVAQQYGLNARDLANLKFPQDIYKTNLAGKLTALNNYLTGNRQDDRLKNKTLYDAYKTERGYQMKNTMMQQANSYLKAYEATGDEQYLKAYQQLMGIAQLIDTGNSEQSNVPTYSSTVVDAYGD